MNDNKKIIIFLKFTIVAVIILTVWRVITTPTFLPKALTSEELQNNLTEKRSGIVYIGRPTCPSCQKFEAKLKKISKNYDAKIQYYNTDKARKNNEQQLDKLLSTLNIKSIPTIIHIKDGVVNEKISEKISDEQLIDFFKQYALPIK